MDKMRNNPENLQLGQKYIIRHKSMASPWIEVQIVHFDQEEFPIGRNYDQGFYERLDHKYEIKKLDDNTKIEALNTWIERSKHDKQKYPNEENAFNYYWSMTH